MSNDESSEEKQETEVTTPLENEKALAETQKAIAEAQKAAAEAQKATVDALIPAAKLSPQEGKTEADTNFGYIAELVAYQSLRERSKEIGKEIDAKVDPKQKHKILIVKDLDFASDDVPLIHLESLLDYYEKAMDAQLADNGLLIKTVLGRPRRGLLLVAALAAAGVVGVAADIIGYFKTDYKIFGQDFTLQDHAIYASVASSIKKVPVHIFKFSLIESSAILDNFKNLVEKKTKLQTSVAKLKSIVIKRLNTDIDELKKTNSQLEAASAKLETGNDIKTKIEEKIEENKKTLGEMTSNLDEVNAAVLSSETILTNYASFVESITKTPEDKSPSLLLKAILRKTIRENNFTHLLNLKILSAGGEAVTMQQRIGKSGKLIFIGGCALSYILVEKDGAYVMANTHHGLAHLCYDLGKADQPLKITEIANLAQTQ